MLIVVKAFHARITRSTSLAQPTNAAGYYSLTAHRVSIFAPAARARRCGRRRASCEPLFQCMLLILLQLLVLVLLAVDLLKLFGRARKATHSLREVKPFRFRSACSTSAL